jgi:hypothetical protein
MSDSTISFSKDVASTLGLSEAVLLEVLKKSGLEGTNLKELLGFLSFWTEEEVLAHLTSLLSKGLIVENKNGPLSSFSIKEIQGNGRRESSMENSWQPEKELLDQTKNLNHEFLASEIPYTVNPGGPNHEELACLSGRLGSLCMVSLMLEIRDSSF